jgi:hypothetical protein
VREEVAALFAWARTVTVADVAPASVVAGAAGRLVDELRVADGVVALAAEAVAAVQRVLLDEHRPVGDLLTQPEYEQLVAVLVGMTDARRELLDVLTTSEAYNKLVAHVLYHGVKSYVLTENVIARKVPGAGALVRLGQRGLASAAPGLEGTVDRQLRGFVQANIADTLRESQRFLDSTLDEPLLTTMAGEAWQENAGRSVASLAGLAQPEQVRRLVAVAVGVVGRLGDAGELGPAVATVVEGVLRMRADRSLGDLFDEAGVSEDWVVQAVLAALGPAAEQARTSGLLEARVRNRLEAFYATYPPAGGGLDATSDEG